MADCKMYKISEVDAAIAAVFPSTSGIVDDIKRVMFVNFAAAEMFRTSWPEDHHSVVLRMALNDLNDNSAFSQAEWDV